MSGRRMWAGLGWTALVLASAWGVAACASILGIDTRTLDPELADTSTADTSTADTSTANGDAGTGDAAPVDAPSGNDGSVSTSDALAIPDVVVPDVVATDSGGTSTCGDPCRMATNLNHPFLMASDAQNVYWTEFGDDLGSGNGYVKACPIAGCPAGGPVVYAQGLLNPRGIAVDGTNVYFGTASYGGVGGGIWSCTISGCGGSATKLASAGIPYGVAVDATYVYWVDNDDGSVHKFAKAGAGSDVVLYDGGSYDDAGDSVIEPGQCIVDGLVLYFMDANAYAYRLATTGGAPVVLGTTTYSAPYGITTDPASVYFGGSGQILRVSKTVAGAAVPIADTVSDPVGLAFDPTTAMIYWANAGSSGNDGTLGKVAPDGGGLHVLAAGLDLPEAVSISGNYALWLSNGVADSTGSATPGTGAIWRTTK